VKEAIAVYTSGYNKHTHT